MSRTIKGEVEDELGYSTWNEYVYEDRGTITKKCFVRVYNKKGGAKVLLTSTKTLPPKYDFRN
jgi:hypothetical protein